MSDSHPLRVVYKTVEGQEIDADLYLPQSPKVPCPLLIDIHGSAHMLGSSGMINKDQVADCLARGWIVVSPNHRLCPGFDILKGPMQEIGDFLSWIYDGGLDYEFSKSPSKKAYSIDYKYVFAMGTSTGGHLALCLGYDVRRPVAGIYSMYGAYDFSNEFADVGLTARGL